MKQKWSGTKRHHILFGLQACEGPGSFAGYELLVTCGYFGYSKVGSTLETSGPGLGGTLAEYVLLWVVQAAVLDSIGSVRIA